MLEAVPWENPTYGILGRAAGNVAYGGTVNPPRNRKGGAGNPPARPRPPRTRRAGRRAPRRRTSPQCAATPAWYRSDAPAARAAAPRRRAPRAPTPYTSAARSTPPMFSGRLGRCSATAANASLIGLSFRCIEPVRWDALAEPDSAFRLPLLPLFLRASESSGFPFPPRLAPRHHLGLHRTGATGWERFRDGTSRRHAGLPARGNGPPPHGWHRVRRDCARVRSSLSPGAVGAYGRIKLQRR